MSWLSFVAGLGLGSLATVRPMHRHMEVERRKRAQAWSEIDRELERAAERNEHALSAAHEASLAAFDRKNRLRRERIERIRQMMGERQ